MPRLKDKTVYERLGMKDPMLPDFTRRDYWRCQERIRALGVPEQRKLYHVAVKQLGNRLPPFPESDRQRQRLVVGYTYQALIATLHPEFVPDRGRRIAGTILDMIRTDPKVSTRELVRVMANA
jgi:hypothetical protein